MTLAKPDFAVYTQSGAIKWLYCKVCGAKIGHRDRMGFVRTPDYAEVKIRFDDGSFHVTSGCKNCLSTKMDKRILQEMYEADCADDKNCRMGDRRPVEVVVVSYDQGGII